MSLPMPTATAERTPTILLVEDDAAIVDVLRRLFALEGFAIRNAATGSAALETLAQAPVDLVVLDLMLPDMTGYEVCARLRARDAPPIPIMMLTALARQEQVRRGLELGADDYLVKPFDPGELLLRVTGLLRRSQAALTAERERVAWLAQIRQAQADATAARSDAVVERTLRGELLHNLTTHFRTLSNAADHAVRRFPTGPLREAAEQLRQRICGAALVYELSEALQSDPVAVGEVIRMVARGLKAVYRPSRRVIAEVSGPPLDVPSAIGAPVALLCNELVTNCFKHAFPDNRFGSVTISYRMEHGELLIRVADNGCGFDVAAPANGRGRPAVETLARELGGTIGWTSSTQGTQVVVRLPLEPARAA